jgi:hypothetical protein
VNWVLYTIYFNILLLMFYVDLYIINVYVILPPDLGPFAVNKYIHTYMSKMTNWKKRRCRKFTALRLFQSQSVMTDGRRKYPLWGTHDTQVSNTVHGSTNLWNCTYFLSQIQSASGLSWFVTLISRYERIRREKLTAFFATVHHEQQFCRTSSLCFLVLNNSA